MPKVISSKEAAQLLKPNNRICFGGFLAVGCAENIIDAIIEAQINDLHMIVIASDYENRGVGKLIVNKLIKSAQVSHLGTNKAIQEQMNKGEIDIEMVPQGTLMERVRATGAGLGGILTPTGVDTIVEKDKEKFNINGKDFILEKAIESDFAVIRAYKADKLGNLIYRKTARNSNPIMAMSAKTTIVEVDEIVEVGNLSPEEIITPGVFVDYIVVHKEN
ncbi:MAG: 3-oxoacid CoA-transferase subunit A [Candidatus Cloacimonetes bacterium]|jgi:3-oxoacid CoA-transferase A subunit|nr:3-oxoacid CoA-transferase subunit A [Candidatus Cloacimonadota bacterium]MDD4155543.1 3-oxoacid CoA-transferase subunit A [Candidatus Cloacimonadota bacterium]